MWMNPNGITEGSILLTYFINPPTSKSHQKLRCGLSYNGIQHDIFNKKICVSLFFLNWLVEENSLKITLGVTCGCLVASSHLKSNPKAITNLLYKPLHVGNVFPFYMFFHGSYAIGFEVNNEPFHNLGIRSRFFDLLFEYDTQ
jgi:hypothetical protein